MSKAPVITAALRGYTIFRGGFLRAFNLFVGDPLGLIREQDNPVDSNAVLVTDTDELPVGYIQREKAGELAKWMDAGWVYECKVIQSAARKHIRGDKVTKLGIVQDSIILRCTPIAPIALKKKVVRSVFSDIDAL